MKKVREEELKNVTGGMKIVVIKSPKFISQIFKFIFKFKKTLGEGDVTDFPND